MDFNNLKLKQKKVVITAFILMGTTGDLCDICHTTEFESSEHTCDSMRFK